MDLAVFAAYFVLVAGVALRASRQTVSTKRDYFLAGDKLPWWMVGGSIIASNISSHHFVGIMGVAYTSGFVALTIAWPAIFTASPRCCGSSCRSTCATASTPCRSSSTAASAARRGWFTGCLISLTYVFVEISAVLYLGALVCTRSSGSPSEVSIVILAVLTACTRSSAACGRWSGRKCCNWSC